MPAGLETAAGPAVILVAPQLGENIGASARAMLNCGLLDLRIVAPRDGWPNPAAEAAAAGASKLLGRARLFETTRAAIRDLHVVYAATARSRDLRLPVRPVDAACRELADTEHSGQRGGILFGPEAAGLSTADVALANRVLHIPLSPMFRSLNLAQAVLLVAWEYRREAAAEERPPRSSRKRRQRAASAGELDGFMSHLEQELEAGRFFRVPERREILLRDLRNLFQRAGLKESEVQLLHGMITALTGRRRDGRPARRKPRPESPDATG